MSVAKVLDLIVAKGLEYTLHGDPQTAKEYDEAIIWHSEGSAPTWAQIQAGIVLLENQETNKAAEKVALLERLGITSDEAKLLIS